jgi:hypothetical protein
MSHNNLSTIISAAWPGGANLFHPMPTHMMDDPNFLREDFLTIRA